MRARRILGALGVALFLGGIALAAGEALKPIPLPKPQMEGGKPLMRVLRDRQTSRSFGPEKLSRAAPLEPALGGGRSESPGRKAHRPVGGELAGD